MKVLIVDDEDLVRKSLGRAFTAKNHDVYLADGGISGMKLWKEHSPDIILLDVLMPDMSGPKVLETMQGQGFVILMSAYKGEYDSMTAKNLGANEFFEKPFENIFSTVEAVEKAFFDYNQAYRA